MRSSVSNWKRIVSHAGPLQFDIGLTRRHTPPRVPTGRLEGADGLAEVSLGFAGAPVQGVDLGGRDAGEQGFELLEVARLDVDLGGLVEEAASARGGKRRECALP